MPKPIANLEELHDLLLEVSTLDEAHVEFFLNQNNLSINRFMLERKLDIEHATVDQFIYQVSPFIQLVAMAKIVEHPKAMELATVLFYFANTFVACEEVPNRAIVMTAHVVNLLSGAVKGTAAAIDGDMGEHGDTISGCLTRMTTRETERPTEPFNPIIVGDKDQ